MEKRILASVLLIPILLSGIAFAGCEDGLYVVGDNDGPVDLVQSGNGAYHAYYTGTIDAETEIYAYIGGERFEWKGHGSENLLDSEGVYHFVLTPPNRFGKRILTISDSECTGEGDNGEIIIPV